MSSRKPGASNPDGSLNRLKAALGAGEPSFGLIATIPSIQSVQALASAGVDWLIIDMEHGAIDVSVAHAMIVATAGTSTVPLVRLPWSHPWQAKPAMDLGALGIVFPMICTREQADAAVRAVRYPPKGERLWGPFYAPMRWGRAMPQYIDAANDGMLAIITVEHPDAVRNIDALMSVPGVDLAFIGPGDLAMSLGIPGQFEHPKFKEAVAQAEAGILRSKVPLGGVARTPQQAKRMLDRGYRALVFGFDWMLLQESAARFLEEVRG
jgi:4-hydroxy-2-oxoheptanedioate aldolase